MAAFVCKGCRVSRKPWRKLWCDRDNRALSAHKAHQSRAIVSWLILAQGSPTSVQLGVKTNKSRRGRSILFSSTVPCVVINIHRRDMVSAGQWGVGEWVEPSRERTQFNHSPGNQLDYNRQRPAPTIVGWSSWPDVVPPFCKSSFRLQSTKGTMDYVTLLAVWKE